MIMENKLATRKKIFLNYFRISIIVLYAKNHEIVTQGTIKLISKVKTIFISKIIYRNNYILLQQYNTQVITFIFEHSYSFFGR